MLRLQCNQNQLFALCSWIKTRHNGRSFTNEPRLGKLWLLSTHSRGDKADRKAVMEASGPAEQPLQAGSTQDFSRANEHLP